jgi:Spy/CpxP family protein refolding chaperone
MKISIISRFILIFSAFIFTGIGTSALAGWGGMGYGHHGSMHHGWGHHEPGWHRGGSWGPASWGNLSDDEIKALQKERSTFVEATEDLRQQIFQKRLELRSELAKKDPDAKKAAKIQQEISRLETDFDQKRLDHIMKVKKISPKSGRVFTRGESMGPGMSSYGCPNYESSQHMGFQRGYGMGPYMMGRGMNPQSGYGRGPGMMDRGPGRMGRGKMQGSPEMGPGSGYRQGQGTLTKEDARSIVEDYLASTRNPNLKLGKIEDVGDAYKAEIVTKDNSLVDQVLVDKSSGWMQPAY